MLRLVQALLTAGSVTVAIHYESAWAIGCAAVCVVLFVREEWRR